MTRSIAAVVAMLAIGAAPLAYAQGMSDGGMQGGGMSSGAGMKSGGSMMKKKSTMKKRGAMMRKHRPMGSGGM